MNNPNRSFVNLNQGGNVSREFERLALKNDLMMEEVKLCKTVKERQLYDRLADFYAIIQTTELLENLRMSGAIEKEEYDRECSLLISQFKDTESVLMQQSVITDTRTFLQEHGLGSCSSAIQTLLVDGVPRPTNVPVGAQYNARQAAETTQCFITAMDALKLEQKAVDEIQPILRELMESLTKMPGLPASFEPSEKINHWLRELNQMRAAQELSDDQVRQLLHDLDSSYSGFFKFLERERGK